MITDPPDTHTQTGPTFNIALTTHRDKSPAIWSTDGTSHQAKARNSTRWTPYKLRRPCRGKFNKILRKRRELSAEAMFSSRKRWPSRAATSVARTSFRVLPTTTRCSARETAGLAAPYCGALRPKR